MPNSSDEKIIFIACFPKSASTYMTNLISKITDFPRGVATYEYGHNEQDVYEPYLVLHKPAVIQQHTKGTLHNIRLLLKHAITPVILVRNIFDVIISLYDHIEIESPVMPSVYIHQKYFEMSRDDRLMFLIRGALPWYFNFLSSWNDVKNEISCFWTSYEEFFSDQQKGMEQILAFNNLEISSKHIEETITTFNTRDHRFNVGIAGRGANLSRRHRQAVTELAKVWKLDEHLAQKVGIQLTKLFYFR